MRDRAEGIGLRECPACGRLADHRRRFTVNGCDIIQCRDCGLGRTNRVGDFDPARYYTADYFAGRRADGYSDYLGAEPVLRREFARSVQFVRRFRSGGKLLELGCAYGFFLTEAASFFDVAGIELAREPAEHAQRSGLHVLHGSANSEISAELDDLTSLSCLTSSSICPNRTKRSRSAWIISIPMGLS